jgi:hypothetical protein
MNCPVCGAEARNETPGDFAGLIVDCRQCGNYELPDEVLNDFLRLDFDARRSALQQARQAATAGARPSISRAYF